MKKTLIIGIVLLALSLFTSCKVYSYYQNLGLPGRIYVNNMPASAGLTVVLIHPQLGRSFSYTDYSGLFYFGNVPQMPSPYYIEVFWMNNLLYRNQINVNEAPIAINLYM